MEEQKIIYPISTVLTNIKELITCAGTTQIVKNALILISGEGIMYAGDKSSVPAFTKTKECKEIDCSQYVILPGFVDASMPIVVQPQYSSEKNHIESIKDQLHKALTSGTTTVGISIIHNGQVEDVHALLRSIQQLKRQHPLDIIPVLHCQENPEKKSNEQYLNTLIASINQMASESLVTFVDIHCDPKEFTPKEAQTLLHTTRKVGLPTRIFTGYSRGAKGVPLAIEHRSLAIGHLAHTTKQDLNELSAYGRIGILLPKMFTPAQMKLPDITYMIKKNIPLALASASTDPSDTTMGEVIAKSVETFHVEIIQSVAMGTINAASAIAMDTLVGSLAPGKQADLLFFANKSHKHIITNIIVPTAVMKRGNIMVGSLGDNK